MKYRGQKVLAVMIVTAALCADRAIAAAPALPPAMGEMAAGFVNRLASNLGRTVRVVAMRQNRSVNDRPVVVRVVAPIQPVGLHQAATPFQFRLPPPLV